MSGDALKADFEDSLEAYVDRVRRANSEAARGHHFLNFIQDTFSTLQSDKPT